MTTSHELTQDAVNTLRFLAADMMQQSHSGRPGLPIGAAPMAYVLWLNHLRHNPSNPRWVDRDRCVPSTGYGSILLYALLHLSGYSLSLDDLKTFRPWNSPTPGLEATTGPLDQGTANAVGMAIAEAHLSERYNRPGHSIIDHHTYVLSGAGEDMQGASIEACSLAGHLGLGKLILLYDDNRISLEGSTSRSFGEDTRACLAAYGWHTQIVADGNDLAAIDAALLRARQELEHPSLIAVRTSIAPTNQGRSTVYGSPRGEEELQDPKKHLGWQHDARFHIPDEVKKLFRGALTSGHELEGQWQQRFFRYSRSYPDLAQEFKHRISGALPEKWDKGLPHFTSPISTSAASGQIIQGLAASLPEFVGCSADPNPSSPSRIQDSGDFQSPAAHHQNIGDAVDAPRGYAGRNLHFGMHQHSMGAIASGMALHGGLIPYMSTFLTFSDYLRPAIRLAALSGLQVVFLFTHDGSTPGEDVPTHQPIEHLMSLRLIPNLTVIRPCDAAETVEAWRAAIENTAGPTALILSRQELPLLDRHRLAPATGLRQGAYILKDSGKKSPQVILIATGAEAHLALEAAARLTRKGLAVRLVSMPSWELFARQTQPYRDQILPPQSPVRIAVEAGIRLGWEHHVGLVGEVIGLDGLGASAPGLLERSGITAEEIVRAAEALLRQVPRS